MGACDTGLETQSRDLEEGKDSVHVGDLRYARAVVGTRFRTVVLGIQVVVLTMVAAFIATRPSPGPDAQP